MKRSSHPADLLLAGALFCAAPSAAAAGGGVVRPFRLDARVRYAPLLRSLPANTSVYYRWTSDAGLRKALPEYVAAALVGAGGDDAFDGEEEDAPLIGPPLHVQQGDVLSATLRNALPTTGLSLHWHGFKMADALAYDGVVGVTQCPVPPGGEFAYRFAVEETPGTYWWHTHSVSAGRLHDGQGRDQGLSHGGRGRSSGRVHGRRDDVLHRLRIASASGMSQCCTPRRRSRRAKSWPGRFHPASSCVDDAGSNMYLFHGSRSHRLTLTGNVGRTRDQRPPRPADSPPEMRGPQTSGRQVEWHRSEARRRGFHGRRSRSVALRGRAHPVLQGWVHPPGRPARREEDGRAARGRVEGRRRAHRRHVRLGIWNV